MPQTSHSALGIRHAVRHPGNPKTVLDLPAAREVRAVRGRGHRRRHHAQLGAVHIGARAVIVAKEAGVVSGLEIAQMTFREVDLELKFRRPRATAEI